MTLRLLQVRQRVEQDGALFVVEEVDIPSRPSPTRARFPLNQDDAPFDARRLDVLEEFLDDVCWYRSCRVELASDVPAHEYFRFLCHVAKAPCVIDLMAQRWLGRLGRSPKKKAEPDALDDSGRTRKPPERR
jgi:hypothetical protein